MTDKYISRTELAQHLNVSTRTIKRMVNKGTITPALKVSNRERFDLDEVLKSLKVKKP